jgi:hypothetical protein
VRDWAGVRGRGFRIRVYLNRYLKLCYNSLTPSNPSGVFFKSFKRKQIMQSKVKTPIAKAIETVTPMI